MSWRDAVLLLPGAIALVIFGWIALVLYFTLR